MGACLERCRLWIRMLGTSLAENLLRLVRATRLLRSASALIAAYRWVFLALGGLSACAAVVAWSIPDLDLAPVRPTTHM